MHGEGEVRSHTPLSSGTSRFGLLFFSFFLFAGLFEYPLSQYTLSFAELVFTFPLNCFWEFLVGRRKLSSSVPPSGTLELLQKGPVHFGMALTCF